MGCGGGLAVIALAEAYPRSTFVGYDTSDEASSASSREFAGNGLDERSPVQSFREEPLPGTPTFDPHHDLFDVIHDTPYPQDLIAQIYGALQDDGRWLCEDIKGFDSFEDNFKHHPIAATTWRWVLRDRMHEQRFIHRRWCRIGNAWAYG